MKKHTLVLGKLAVTMAGVILFSLTAHAARFPLAGSFQLEDSAKNSKVTPPQTHRKLASTPLLSFSGIVGEIEAKRSLTSKVFYHGNGRYSALLATYPLHYQDQAGNWTPIDTTIVNLAGQKRYACETNVPKFYFSELRPDITIKLDGNDSLDIRSMGIGLRAKDGKVLKNIPPAEASPIVLGNVLSYRGSYEGLTGKMSVGLGSLRHEVLLEQPQEWMRTEISNGKVYYMAYRFNLPQSYTLWANGEKVLDNEVMTGNPIILQNHTGEAALNFLPPIASEGFPGKSFVQGTLRVKVTGNQVSISEEIPLFWILETG